MNETKDWSTLLGTAIGSSEVVLATLGYLT